LQRSDVATAPILSVAAAGAVAALPGVVQVGDQVLAATSCALRETLWIDHYAAKLYVRPGDTAENALLDARSAKALEIQLINKSFMPGEIPRKYRRALEADLDEATMNRLSAAYRALRPGDVVTIAYLPARGVSLSVNRELVAVAPAHRVVESLLATWAGGKPVDQHLRTALAKHPCPPITG
jgi:hypothetical protein